MANKMIWGLVVLTLIFSRRTHSAPVYRVAACPRTSITVSDERAVSGKQSLKFSDHADAKRPGFPYLILSPKSLRNGARFSCQLYLEEDAAATVEFRTTPSARNAPVGPSVHINREGIHVGGKRVTALPVEQWIKLTITFRFGTGTFDLELTPSTGRSQHHNGLPCKSPDFRACAWVGIISTAQKQTAFFVDDLELLPLN